MPEPTPFSPEHYTLPRTRTRYDRVMGAIVNGGFAALVWLLRA